MTGLLIFIIVVIIVLALVLWAIRSIPNMDGTVLAILQVAAILIAAIVIAQRAGVF